jgi:hypothetical protein
MTTTQLQSEFTSNPLPYAALLNVADDAGVAAILNAKNYTIQGPVTFASVMSWLGEIGATVPLQKLAITDGPLQNIAATFLLCVQGGIGTIVNGVPCLNVTDPAINGMISALVAGGIFTADQKAALFAIGLIPVSRAEVINGIGDLVTATDVAWSFGRRP